ncbi:MAG: O-antigen ligase family protein [Hyphomicrobiales bacterium]
MSIAQDIYHPVEQPAKKWTLSTRSLGNSALGLIVFLGGFVFFEPAPYELLLVPLLIIWFAFGLTLHRAFLPLTSLMLCFICGGAIAVTQKADIAAGFFYIIVTGFLVTTSIFFAAVVANNPQERLRIIFKAYCFTAIIGSLIGILAYFHLLPNSESYLFGGRARGPFQDPNVFGPFLVLPAVFLLRNILVNSTGKSLGSILGLLIIMSAIFLAFSRAAWGLTLVACVMMTMILFITAPDQRLRSKIILASIFMGALMVGFLLIALSVDAISSLFEERARLVQSYDSARFGRFARYGFALQWIMEGPLGYGFGKSREAFGEDTHNVYIKAFLVYGWLGGISYLALVLSTLLVGFKHLFKITPWQGYFQCCYVVIFGHAIVGLVVDIDRWRHLYLIYGIAWGMIAAYTILQSSKIEHQKTH